MIKKPRGFYCLNCQSFVPITEKIGTRNRNHCPSCLWSRHVDLKKSGDRRASCGAGMEPIGLTFKEVGPDKWGHPQIGELMIIHKCIQDGKLSINRIAADDKAEQILQVFEESKQLDGNIKTILETEGIKLLEEKDREEILKQLFGLQAPA